MENSSHINYFAQTDFRGKRIPFGIKSEDRSRHIYIIGKTGMGKSTMLENMAIQDIKNGEGMCFIDPHGKTADLLLSYVPKERLDDVVYIAPFDLEYPVAFNVMEDVGKDQRHLVAAGLMSAFKKIWVDAWSARMEYILNNTILALLEYPGSTLLSVNKMISDKAYRQKVVDKVTDPGVRSFWVDEFANYTDRFAAEATPAIQNKVGQFTSNPLIRNILGQSKSSFNFRDLMDKKKIVIINLSKGLIGEGNASLIGSMLVTKIYLSAMSRANVSEEEMRKLPPFYLYVDEFQSFANESFADILSEARKYKLSLTIAHQYVEQMPDEVKAAVFGNVGTTVSFRVGPLDAELLEKLFLPTFTQEDIVALSFTQIYLTLMIDGVGSKPFSATTLPPIPQADISYKDEVIKRSRATYANLREKVEQDIVEIHQDARSANSNSNSNSNSQNNKKSNQFNQPKKPVEKNEPSRPAVVEAKKDPKDNFDLVSTQAPSKNTPSQLSLDLLKKKSDKIEATSKSSETGKSALRSVLAEIMNADTKPDNKPKTDLAQDSKPPLVKVGETKENKSEVPEDVLLNLLNVDK